MFIGMTILGNVYFVLPYTSGLIKIMIFFYQKNRIFFI